MHGLRRLPSSLSFNGSIGDIDEAYRWLEIAAQEGIGTQPVARPSSTGFDPTRATGDSSVAWASTMAGRQIASRSPESHAIARNFWRKPLDKPQPSVILSYDSNNICCFS